ncbi:hypothetical protein [Nocardioides dongkuii]|nr:hypothetical protein [Nocardioides dongkuii]
MGATVVVAVYRATQESERGLYAGAEPVAVGVLVAGVSAVGAYVLLRSAG